jgi:hypothetical protein
MTWHNVKISLISASYQNSDLNYDVAYIPVLGVRYRLGYSMERYICKSRIDTS